MIGELTPWYTRQKEYADSQIQQQQAAMGAMKLDSLMKAQRDFEQMSAEEKLKQIATPTPTAPVTDKTKAVPTAVPPAATETTPTTRSADGTPMPSFNTGTASAEPASNPMPSFMDTGKPAEAAAPAAEANKEVATGNKPAKEEKTQVPLLDEMKNSNTDYKASKDRVDFMYRFADKLRQSGNLLAYQDAIKVADNAKTTMYDHQIKNLALQDKFLDTASGPVYAYKKAMEKIQLNTSDPQSLKDYQEASDKAWATMKLDLQSRGIPTSSIDGINSWQDRAQRADTFINGALNGKEQITLATKEAELKAKEERNKIMDRHYQNQDNLALQKQIFNQTKFNEKAANDLLKDSESDIKSLRMSLNTAISKDDRDNFRKALIEAQAKHDQLVKDLKEKAKTDGIKWTPVITGATKEEAAPVAATNNVATATNEAAPKTATLDSLNSAEKDWVERAKARPENAKMSYEDIIAEGIKLNKINPNASPAPSTEKEQLKADLEATKKQLAELKPLPSRLGGMLPDKVGGGAFEILGNYRKQKAESDKKRKELEDRIKAIEEKLKAS